jgi:iron complex transport system substrate-binding protein
MRALGYIVGAALLVLSGQALAADTFTYSYDGYTAELPLHPKRVFVMDSRTGLDFAISAQFPIVATDWDEGTVSQFEPDLPKDADRLSFRNEPNSELVLRYNPDLLVVGAGWWKYWQEKALFKSGAVPVLVVEDGSDASWKAKMVGQLTAYGMADRAAELMAQYDAAVAEAKPLIARVLHGRKVAIADVWGADSVALHADTFSTAVAHDLGIDLVAAPGVTPTDDGYQVLSPENLAPLDDAALVMSLWTADIAGNPMWQRIPAVKGGAQYEMDIANSWGFALTATDLVHDFEKAMTVLEKADNS